MNAVLDLKTETTVPLTPEGLPVLGCHDGVLDTDYRRAPGINKSSLDRIAKSPATYDFERRYPPPGTPSMVFGSALHCLVLEPERFEQTYIPDGTVGSQSKEAKLWRMEQQAAGKIVINSKGDPTDPWDRSDWDMLHWMRDAVMANGVAAALIEDAARELSMWWLHPEIKKLCKGRLDGWSPAHNVALDLKTTSDATYSGFSRSIHDYRYHCQAAMYSDGLRACGKLVEAFVFVAVERNPPYLCACYILPSEWLNQGRAQYERDLLLFKKCKEEEIWPGLDELRELQMPSYAKFGRIG